MNMQYKIDKVKRLTELKQDPSLALYDTMQEQHTEVLGNLGELADALTEALTAVTRSVEQFKEENYVNQEDLGNAILDLKTYLDDLEIEVIL